MMPKSSAGIGARVRDRGASGAGAIRLGLWPWMILLCLYDEPSERIYVAAAHDARAATSARSYTTSTYVTLGARGISTAEAEQPPRNRHATVRNPGGGGHEGERLLLIGHTDGGRALTLVIERTVDPTSWLIVTGWTATERERRIIS